MFNRPTVDLSSLLNTIQPQVGNAAVFANSGGAGAGFGEGAESPVHFGGGGGASLSSPTSRIADYQYQAQMRLLDGGGSTGGVPALMIWQLADDVVEDALFDHKILSTIVRAAKTEMVDEHMFRLSTNAEDNVASDVLDEVL